MRFVDDYRSVVSIGQAVQIFEFCPVPVHTEDAFDDDKSLALVRRQAKRMFELIEVRVRVNNFPTSRQSNSVDDTGVIEFIADNRVSVS